MENTPKICLLDDDPSVLKSTGRLLASAGWGAVPFSDPHAFLSHAQAHQPPLAILDIYMPVLNGLEVQARLRELSPSTRVIFLSAVDSRAIQEQAMRGGAVAYLLKPVDDEDFLAEIESAMANGRGSQAEARPKDERELTLSDDVVDGRLG